MKDETAVSVPESALLILRVAGLSLAVKALQHFGEALEARIQQLERAHDEPQPPHPA
jgi:hypothetical protein